jgi:predicted helicase
VTTIHDVLEDFRVRARNTRELGDLFEQLMVGYFKTDPFYTEQFSDVWLWMDWPGREGSDTGIDIVAKDKEGEGYCAIQCKFYPEDHVFSENDLGTFLTQSGKRPFTSRLFVSTTTHWGRNADQAIRGQTIPVRRIGLQDLNESAIDWSKFKLAAPGSLELKAKKDLRPHQREAIDDVFKGWEEHDRGRLIMACGTGKTFTALKLAEELAARKKGKDQTNVLFLVPSISLIQQTLREWTTECAIDLQSFAVCSDIKVGRGRTIEDISVTDLAFPATTDTKKLLRQMGSVGQHGGLTTIFSTYQSIAVVSQAQKEGLPEFDLIVCDEAHRTTGVKVAGEDESAFVRVHDNSFISSRRRLYMTATPRLYDESAKQKANEREAVVWSMDDEAKFGPEFHRLGFGKAVGEDLLSDYRVLILAVDEKFINSSLQSQVADKNSEISLEDTTKIVGCWNGLAKRSGETPDGQGFGLNEVPMRRAVAFSRTIAESKALTSMFNDVLGEYAAATDDALQCEVQHVDGTQNALVRGAALDWLRTDPGENECRILSNARCLSEGVDVPNLDAVMFLNPRDSQVDVVQAVGRVMRKAPGKDYGYIILPIAIPSDLPADEALSDNKRYRVVWQILQALRAHDDRFNATINKIDLNKKKPRNIMVGTVGFDSGDDWEERKETATQMAFDVQVEEWRDAIYAKIVQKVGERTYWETWAHDIAAIAERHTEQVKGLLASGDTDLKKVFAAFLTGLRKNLNDSITEDQAIEMLSQHQVTRPVFEALFEDYSFASSNPVSIVMQQVLDILDRVDVQEEFESLEPFYESVRRRAADIDNAEGKQRIIIELYEKFFKLAFPRTAESLGIVYTPVEIVDFIIRSVEYVLGSEFGASVEHRHVHLLDPFTGTGTFMVRLIQNGLISREALREKYLNEFHANEIVLLAYYLAAINIEAAYHGVVGGEYEPFEGIVLTDTFQSTESDDSMDEVFFPQNNERLVRQKAADITVIMANPPYSVGQGSENDDNKNLKYPTLDESIRSTYAARSAAVLKTGLYDSYVRAFRWASSRIGNRGIICFVSNGSFIDSGVFDGFRKTIVDEFASVYCFNLRGNQRTSGETSRREGGKVFGGGSRTPVAITLVVKNPEAPKPCKVNYYDIGDYLTREQKLGIVEKFGSVENIEWEVITPDVAGDWINQRDTTYASFPSLGDKRNVSPQPVFEIYSGGIKTNRDAWAYNYSRDLLLENMCRMAGFYNEQVNEFVSAQAGSGERVTTEVAARFIDRNPKKISWTRELINDLRLGKHAEIHPEQAIPAMYRPFCKEWLYLDRQLNNTLYLIPKLFPTAGHQNLVIHSSAGEARRVFSALITNVVPDIHLHDTGQAFPLYYYEESAETGTMFSTEETLSGYSRRDGISDEVHERYQSRFGPDVTKEDIFFYVYGVLHSPAYRSRYESDLKKDIPRLPMVEDFGGYCRAGRALGQLHLNYESVEPWPLEGLPTGNVAAADLRVEKMRFNSRSRADKGSIAYNSQIVLSGIPDEAHLYLVNGKSAVEWLMDRYQLTVDKDSGIVNDPNTWSEDPRYIVDLVARVVRVSVETMRIVESLPPLEIIEP